MNMEIGSNSNILSAVTGMAHIHCPDFGALLCYTLITYLRKKVRSVGEDDDCGERGGRGWSTGLMMWKVKKNSTS